MKRIIVIAAIVGLMLPLAVSHQAEAALFEINLDFNYSGSDDPQGDPPWLTAIFEDISLDTVKLTLDAGNLVGVDEFVSDWLFNVDVVNPVSLSWSYDSSSSTGPEADISASQNGESLPPATGFDIELGFNPSNADDGGLRFDAGEQVVYTVSGPNLDAESFNSFNMGGNFLSVAHVQGIDGPFGSGKIAASGIKDIPEAASILSLGVGILGLCLVARRKRLR